MEENDGGRGGSWVNEHFCSFVNVVAALLDVPKAAFLLILGEMRDMAASLDPWG